MKTCVLLAGSESELLQSLPPVLAAAGHRVHLAATGLEALTKARRRLPNLIILDAMLPDMDGTTVCDLLRCLPSTAAIPRILLSARKKESETDAFSIGRSDSVIAPMNTADLLCRVNHMLARKTAVLDSFADLDTPWEPRLIAESV